MSIIGQALVYEWCYKARPLIKVFLLSGPLVPTVNSFEANTKPQHTLCPVAVTRDKHIMLIFRPIMLFSSAIF